MYLYAQANVTHANEAGDAGNGNGDEPTNTDAHHLLNRLHTFNEWGQMSILELVSRYKPTGPKSKDEIYDIMKIEVIPLIVLTFDAWKFIQMNEKANMEVKKK
eukprot:119749_1